MRALLFVTVSLVVAAGAFWAGTRHSQHAAMSSGSEGTRKILYYVDPMNPAHTSDKPGLAPCGMKMEPV